MNKKTLTLGIILIFLVAVAYIYQGPFQDWRARSDKPENFLSKINVDAISKIEIIKKSETVALEKNEEKLKVAGTGDFYASESVAENLLKNLKDASEGDLELVSANKDKKIDFETDASGINVKIYQGDNAVADFIVGKYGNDYASAYISKADADETYLVKANLASALNQAEWRDLAIFKTDKEKISKINFKYLNREFTTEKAGEEWSGIAPYKFAVSKEKIDKILDTMSNLTAVKIPEQNLESTGLDKPNIIVEIFGEGVNNVLMIGNNNGEENYFVKKGDGNNIYLIAKSQRDELEKEIWELK
jgi:hypothetical protein